jgi:transposase
VGVEIKSPFKGEADEDATMAKAQISIPLDIEDVKVLKVEVGVNGNLHITLESTLNYGICRKCGHKLTKVHGYDNWVKVQHLPSFGRAVFLHYRPKRYECPECDGKPTTTQQLAWHEPNSPHTTAYDKYLLLALVNSTVQDVAIKEHLPYETVWGVVERQLAYAVDWTQYTCLGVLGLDEIARLKGHGDFVAIVSARLPDGHVAVLAILPDRKKETIKAFLQSIPSALRATIQSVCSDLYEGYLQAAQEVLPKVRRVVDRFHVAKLYRSAADSLRKAELKRLKRSLPSARYTALTGNLWAFRLPWADLRPEQRQVLQRLFELSPALQQAYALCQALTAIFDLAPSRRSAKKQLRAWQTQVRRSGLTCFDTFLKTLDRFWEEITNYFVAGETSGFVEGLNNKIKVLTRRSYGLFNLDHLFQRLFLDLEGYRLFA